MVICDYIKLDTLLLINMYIMQIILTKFLRDFCWEAYEYSYYISSL
jgi:hypothetical protein